MTGPGPLPVLPAHLSLAATRIDGELRRRPAKRLSLSPDARDALALAHAEYLADLGQEAIRIARRDRLATVDQEHVEQAVRRLDQGAAKGNARTNAANSLGGVFGGAGLASAYAIVFTAGPHSTMEIVVALLLSVVGFSSLVYGLTASSGRR